MVRISDARMSGTAYGTIVLHTAPEAAAGGPLAVVRNGDRIALSVQKKRIDLLVDENEIKRRLVSWAPPPIPERGYGRCTGARSCKRPRAWISISLRGPRESDEFSDSRAGFRTRTGRTAFESVTKR